MNAGRGGSPSGSPTQEGSRRGVHQGTNKKPTMQEQRTIGWYRDRLGKITGSQVGELIGKGKGTPFTQKGMTYLMGVAAERMIPSAIVEDDDFFSEYLDEVNVTSKAMRIGTQREQDARELYESVTGNAVTEVPSIEHPEIRNFASSPDGTVCDGDGAVEIKCPTPTKYMEYLTQVTTPEQLKKFNPTYYWQCIAHMAVTGARWCDFTVYCPYSVKPLHLVPIERDEAEIEKLEARVKEALDVVDELAGL